MSVVVGGGLSDRLYLILQLLEFLSTEELHLNVKKLFSLEFFFTKCCQRKVLPGVFDFTKSYQAELLRCLICTTEACDGG